MDNLLKNKKKEMYEHFINEINGQNGIIFMANQYNETVGQLFNQITE